MTAALFGFVIRLILLMSADTGEQLHSNTSQDPWIHLKCTGELVGKGSWRD